MTEMLTDWLLCLSVCMAVPLLGRNGVWAFEIGRAWVFYGKHTALQMLTVSHRFKAPLIRAGTIFLSVAAIAMLAKLYWVAALCIAALMAWRWLFFARQRSFAISSMLMMAALSTIAVMWRPL